MHALKWPPQCQTSPKFLVNYQSLPIFIRFHCNNLHVLHSQMRDYRKVQDSCYILLVNISLFIIVLILITSDRHRIPLIIACCVLQIFREVKGHGPLSEATPLCYYHMELYLFGVPLQVRFAVLLSFIRVIQIASLLRAALHFYCITIHSSSNVRELKCASPTSCP